MAKKQDDLQKLVSEVEEHFEKESYNEIIKLLSNEILEQYKSAALFAWRSRAYVRLEEPDLGLQFANRAIETDPNFFMGYATRGGALHIKKDYDQAIADYNKAIDLDPNEAYIYSNRGLSYYKKEDYEQALRDFEKAIELNPKFADVYNNRGNLYTDKADFDRAILDYKRAIELNPNYPAAYNNLGNSYSHKDSKLAIFYYDKAIELNPKNAIAYSNRGQAYKALLDFDSALLDFNKAIEINPNYATAYNQRGLLLYQLKNYALAIDDLKRALEKGTDWKWNSYWRDKALEELNKQKEVAKLDEPVTVDELRKGIEDCVAIIRNKTISNEKLVVHYTALHAAKNILTTDKSKMRFYNAIYMNDPEEGEILFNYFDSKKIKESFENGKRVNETSVYLGSFLPAPSHEDELVMWRTYGKDGSKTEAAGCSLVLDSAFFHKDGEIKDKDKTSAEPEQILMRVVYIKNGKFHSAPAGIEDELKNLKKKLLELIKLRGKSDKNEWEVFDRIVFDALSVIAYLFKSADYAFESEVRVVQYIPLGNDLIRHSPNDAIGEPPSKMYIESVREILPYLKKVYLGAKVINPSHWSAYFDYEIRQQSKGKYQVEVAKSICKFQ